MTLSHVLREQVEDLFRPGYMFNVKFFDNGILKIGCLFDNYFVENCRPFHFEMLGLKV